MKPFDGLIDGAGGHRVWGWISCQQKEAVVHVFIGDELIGEGNAQIVRHDLGFRDDAKGFSVTTNVPIDFGMLCSGKLRVSVTVDEICHDLPFWGALKHADNFSKIAFDKLSKAWGFVSLEVKERAKKELSCLIGVGAGFGRISNDGSVQVGRNGHLFLRSGSNDVLGIYLQRIAVDVSGWIRLFEERWAAINDLGAAYLQLVLPEKSSVCCELTPFKALPGSAPYLELVSCCRSKGIPLVDVFHEFYARDDRFLLYPCTDSHFTTRGARAAVDCILRAVGVVLAVDYGNRIDRLDVGDLGRRFESEGDAREWMEYYDGLVTTAGRSQPRIVEQLAPNSGHIGIRRVWKNKSAPFNKRVVCFGNSFFERGLSSRGLSWWFCRLFTEFHFIWSPELDHEYVSRIRPDIVICQTIERFLTKVPAA